MATKVTGQPDQLKNLFNILKYPTYGVDGRVAALSANTEAGTLKNNTFQTDHADYGVRAIGSVTQADPKAHNFALARNGFAQSLRSAQNNAQEALSKNATLLVGMVIGEATGLTPAPNQVEAVEECLEQPEQCCHGLETALKYAGRSQKPCKRQHP